MSTTHALQEVRACRICEASLPLGPRPVLRLSNSARLLIVGQAPGRRAHLSGIPWDDASGVRLRDWMMLDRPEFYDESRVAVLSMGLCYPGTSKNGADRPPRGECAPRWHERLLRHLPELQLTLLVGQHAHRHYLGARRGRSVAETVKAFSRYGPEFFPLPHPSWRSAVWMRRHPWFERMVIPELRSAVREALRGR